MLRAAFPRYRGTIGIDFYFIMVNNIIVVVVIRGEVIFIFNIVDFDSLLL